MATTSPQDYLTLSNNTTTTVFRYKLCNKQNVSATIGEFYNNNKGYRFFYNIMVLNGTPHFQMRSGTLDIAANYAINIGNVAVLSDASIVNITSSGSVTVTWSTSVGPNGTGDIVSRNLQLNVNSTLSSPNIRVSGVILEMATGTLTYPQLQII